jgi:ribosomal protein S18 acetylase RimI-like enzyme
MPLILRPASADDREFLAALADRLADFETPAWRPPAQVAAGDRRDLLAALDAPPPGSALVIADLDGVPAGCLHLVTRIDFFTERPHGHISVIAVTKQAEGRGVGHALMDHAERWSRDRGYDHLTLNVFPGNARALAFYDRHGYLLELISMRKDLP